MILVKYTCFSYIVSPLYVFQLVVVFIITNTPPIHVDNQALTVVKTGNFWLVSQR